MQVEVLGHRLWRMAASTGRIAVGGLDRHRTAAWLRGGGGACRGECGLAPNATGFLWARALCRYLVRGRAPTGEQSEGGGFA